MRNAVHYRKTVNIAAHLCRKRVAVDRVLGAHLVLLTVVYVDLVHLILVRQRSAGDVYVVLGAVLQVEHDAVTGVTYYTVHLRETVTIVITIL